jgi:hypothetical protein
MSNAATVRIYPLYTAGGILERARTMLVAGHHTSGQVAVLMALVAVQAADAEAHGPYYTPTDERRVPSVTVATLASYTRLTPATVQKHLNYWVERGSRVMVRRDLTSPFRAYFIGA